MLHKEMMDLLKMSESFVITMDGDKVLTTIKGSGESVMKFEQAEMTAEADNSPCEDVSEPQFYRPEKLEALMIVKVVTYGLGERTYQIVKVGFDKYILHNIETGSKWTDPMSLEDMYTELETEVITWKAYKNAKLQLVHG